MEISKSAEFSITSGKDYDALFAVPAVIIYPALMTPAIVTGDDSLELLILGHDDYPLTADAVNWQLKISAGLNLEKNYRFEPLFEHEDLYPEDGSESPIKVEEVGEIGMAGAIFETEERFKGIISHWVFENYDKEFKKVYKVTVDGFSTLIGKERMYSAFWLRKKDEAFILHEQSDMEGQMFKFNKEVESELVRKITVNGQTQEVAVTQKWLVANGLADSVAKQVMRDMGTLDNKEKDLYGISDIGRKDIRCPIQAIHPIFYYQKSEYLNIFHFTDLHVSLRQKILAKSKARVIEYSESDGEKDESVSPPIGSLVSCTSGNIVSLFETAGKDDEIDIVCITGDLIDYIRNVYLGDGEFEQDMSIKEIWDKVSLDDGYKTNYKKFVDFIAFYTMVVNFYKDHGKPVFAISGNHDCYQEPYGSSPRVFHEPWYKNPLPEQLANEGVPADHNLTIYEAMVLFGPTYHKVHLAKSPTSNFNNVQFQWMYSMLTPLSDFAVNLPMQSLIGLEWGDDEDLLADAPWSAHGFGHLPRSNKGVSKKQLDLFERAVGWGKKSILMTHFTFVSYKDSIPMVDAAGEKDRGVVDTSYGWVSSNHTSDYDLGTFHNNRTTLFDKYLLEEEKLSVVLTGHSHRRGLYVIKDFEKNWIRSNKVKTEIYDFHDYHKVKNSLKGKSLIIVSDSAGPLPRHNRYGEFKGWGSDKASGTKVVFSGDGEVERLEAKKVGSGKPRIVVALDYVDLLCEQEVQVEDPELGGTIEVKAPAQVLPDVISNEIDKKKMDLGGGQGGGVGFSFRLFNENTVDFDIEREILRVSNVVYLYQLQSSGDWNKFELRFDSRRKQWKVGPDEGDVQDFFDYTKIKNKGVQWYLSIGVEINERSKYRHLKDYFKERYNFGDRWNIEIKLDTEDGFLGMGKTRKYKVSRDKKSALNANLEGRLVLEKYL